MVRRGQKRAASKVGRPPPRQAPPAWQDDEDEETFPRRPRGNLWRQVGLWLVATLVIGSMLCGAIAMLLPPPGV